MSTLSEAIIIQIFTYPVKRKGNEYSQVRITSMLEYHLEAVLKGHANITGVEEAGGIDWKWNEQPTYTFKNDKLKLVVYFGAVDDDLSNFTGSIVFNGDGAISSALVDES